MSDGTTVKMPVLFVGHGCPMNAVEDNRFSREWKEIAKEIHRPVAILCISAHWETEGSLVTGMTAPRTIHDFTGFPHALFDVDYPAPGSTWLVREITTMVRRVAIGIDREWGFDHGCWSVLHHMYPEADIPVVELSLDATKPPRFHYRLAQDLAPLRTSGVLIVASGNIVHNLSRVALPPSRSYTAPCAHPWALEASALIKSLIDSESYEALLDYTALGTAVQLAIPTPEHFLPLLYALALKTPDESITYFNDEAVAGSLTMTSLVVQ